MYPAENQRKGYQSGEDASPHDQEMHQPTCESSLEDEALPNQVGGKCLSGASGVLRELFTLKIKLPAAPPVNSGSRPLQPDRVTKHDCAERDDARDGVAEECGVVMFQIARADDDEHRQQEGSAQRKDNWSPISCLNSHFGYPFPELIEAIRNLLRKRWQLILCETI